MRRHPLALMAAALAIGAVPAAGSSPDYLVAPKHPSYRKGFNRLSQKKRRQRARWGGK